MNAFYGHEQLLSAYFLGSSIPTIGASVFYRTPITNSSYYGYYGSIYVRASMLTDWQNAIGWTPYSDRFVGLTDEQIAAL